MGWDETFKAKGITSKAFFQREFKDHLIELKVKGNVAYGAYKDDIGNIFALVILMRRKKDPYFNFAYKVMDETVGPYNYDCPNSILRLLTPPLNEHSRIWRSKQNGKHNADLILRPLYSKEVQSLKEMGL